LNSFSQTTKSRTDVRLFAERVIQTSIERSVSECTGCATTAFRPYLLRLDVALSLAAWGLRSRTEQCHTPAEAMVIENNAGEGDENNAEPAGWLNKATNTDGNTAVRPMIKIIA
jgi:hypothetical protein